MAWQDDPVVGAAPSGGGWQNDPVAVPAIDFNRPVEAVRADIANLPEGQREAALKQWADAFVANERKQGGVGQGVDSAVRTIARGTFAGPFLDEVTAGAQQAMHTVSGGYAGAPYDETLAYQRAKDRAIDEANPWVSLAGKVAGGLAGAGAAIKAGGVLGGAVGGPLAAMAPASTLPRMMAQGAGAGSVYGMAAGFGEGEGGFENRYDSAMKSGAVGMGIGAALPPVAAVAGRALSKVGEVVSPQVARYQAWRSQPSANPSARVGMTAGPLDDMPSGAGGGQAKGAGADAAAEQIIANQLMRANVPADRLRQQLAEADEAARFYSNSRAPNALAPVDLDPSLQRLAGSVGRQQPEAANTMGAFQFARQTGQTPRQTLADEAGLPTRPAMSRADPNRPMGQFERVRDALKRALLIRDEDFHGHAANAYRTEQAIIKAAKDEAQPAYRAAYDAASGVDLRPVLSPLLQKWSGQLIDEPVNAARRIEAAMKLLQRATQPEGSKSHLERVDKVKQLIDDWIDTAFTSTNARNRYIGGRLTEFKNELLAELDKLQGAGRLYKKARDTFSSRMEARDALNLGRNVFREDSDVYSDQFRGLSSPGLKKLFRLGMLDGFEKHGGRQKRTADVSQMFENPRIQEILQTVIPRTKTATGRAKMVNGAPAPFANRPERFGEYLANEKAMIGTRNVTQGNSMTQRNIKDDEAFDAMGTVSEAIDKFRQSGSLINIGINAVESALSRVFGFREDTAASIARMLFTADPQRRLDVLARVEARMGPTRAAQFAILMQQYQRQVTQAGATAGASVDIPE